MKNLLPLLFIFSVQFGNAQQPYLPLLTDSIRWVNLASWGNFSGPIAHFGNIESTIGSTALTLNDTVFRVFNYQRTSTIPIYIYEDTINRKIFGKRNLDDIFTHLIYDFNLLEGDTFRPAYWGYEDFWPGLFTCKIEFIAREVENLEYEGVMRKTIHLEKFNNRGGVCSGISIIPDQMTIIEGIGSTYLFDYFNDYNINTIDWGFDCVRRVFKNEKLALETDCEPPPEFVSSNNFSKNEITIYPNPINEKLFINNLPIGEELSFQIINLIGEIILKKSFHPLSKELNIQLSKLSSGIYLFILRDNNGERLRTEKLVRQ